MKHTDNYDGVNKSTYLQAEDPFHFAKRIVAAHRNRLFAAVQIRYNYYIDCMPVDSIYEVCVYECEGRRGREGGGGYYFDL